MGMTEQEAINEFKDRLAIPDYRKEISEYYDAMELAVKALEEIEQYRALGTVEELGDIREKQIPYKPEVYEGRYYACKCDNILLEKWEKYPTKLMSKSNGLPYCLACGQKLDWSDEDAE